MKKSRKSHYFIYFRKVIKKSTKTRKNRKKTGKSSKIHEIMKKLKKIEKNRKKQENRGKIVKKWSFWKSIEKGRKSSKIGQNVKNRGFGAVLEGSPEGKKAFFPYIFCFEKPAKTVKNRQKTLILGSFGAEKAVLRGGGSVTIEIYGWEKFSFFSVWGQS